MKGTSNELLYGQSDAETVGLSGRKLSTEPGEYGSI